MVTRGYGGFWHKWGGAPSATLETARVHAQLLAHRPSHETIGTHDALIGATALRHGYAVLTRNARDFRKLASVQVLEYTATS